MVRRSRSSIARLVPVAWGIALSAAVTFPLFGGGFLWLLDWGPGPRPRLVSDGVLGLAGGLVAGVPFLLVESTATRLLSGFGTWIPLFVFFPIAAYGMARLVGGSRWCRLAAATLYCVNPFVFDRIYVGHLALLLGYGFLPSAVRSALRYFQQGCWWLPVPALWWAFLTGLSAHFAWIYGVAILVTWLADRPLAGEVLTRLVTAGTAFLVLSSYLILSHSATRLPLTTRSDTDLSLFRTVGDRHLGLFGNVLGLYGFWRSGATRLPKSSVTGWPLLLAAILIIAAIGLAKALRSPRSAGGGSTGRHLAVSLLLGGCAAYFLSLGDQGPTGPLFRWAYINLPFFAIMREPEKFLMVTALAYAVFFGWGIDQFLATISSMGRVLQTMVSLGLAVVLPLAYTPTLFDGLAGQIGTGRLPHSWISADAAMGTGPGKVLFLPWHLYMSFPFTDNRVVANPAPNAFMRDVISGDNVEAGGVETTSTNPRSAYLEALFKRGPRLTGFGSLLRPLGVQYVVLAKTVDWKQFGWLAQQRDLLPILDSSDLTVWRNTAYGGVASAPTGRPVVQLSPIAYRIGRGRPGVITLDAPYQPGWQLEGQRAAESPQGTIRFRATYRAQTAVFAPWYRTRLGYLISAVAFIGLELAVLSLWIRGVRLRPETQDRVAKD
jgi:hypothetical protein